jgi:TRAP-type transport system periplasmic protein
MRKERVRSTLILGLVLLLLMAVGGRTAYAAVTLKAVNFLPALHFGSSLFEEWGKEVEKRTNGVVKTNFFHEGTLVPPPQIYDSVSGGVADVGISLFAYTPGRFPVMEALDAPLDYEKAVSGSKAATEFYKKFKPKELDDTHVLMVSVGPPAMIHSKTPIRNLEDLKGKKIRTTGTSQRFIKELGAVPVALPPGDIYDSLSKGMIDGVMIAEEALISHKFYEVVPYTTASRKTNWSAGLFLVMNLKTWNAFPADIKKIITDVSEEWAVKWSKAWDDERTRAKDKLEKLGHKYVILTDAEQEKWVKKGVEPFFKSYAEYAKGKGLDGEKISLEVRSLMKKYGDQK